MEEEEEEEEGNGGEEKDSKGEREAHETRQGSPRDEPLHKRRRVEIITGCSMQTRTPNYATGSPNEFSLPGYFHGSVGPSDLQKLDEGRRKHRSGSGETTGSGEVQRRTDRSTGASILETLEASDCGPGNVAKKQGNGGRSCENGIQRNCRKDLSGQRGANQATKCIPFDDCNGEGDRTKSTNCSIDRDRQVRPQYRSSPSELSGRRDCRVARAPLIPEVEAVELHGSGRNDVSDKI